MIGVLNTTDLVLGLQDISLLDPEREHKMSDAKEALLSHRREFAREEYRKLHTVLTNEETYGIEFRKATLLQIDALNLVGGEFNPVKKTLDKIQSIFASFPQSHTNKLEATISMIRDTRDVAKIAAAINSLEHNLPEFALGVGISDLTTGLSFLINEMQTNCQSSITYRSLVEALDLMNRINNITHVLREHPREY